jgi:hypothetical protein
MLYVAGEIVACDSIKPCNFNKCRTFGIGQKHLNFDRSLLASVKYSIPMAVHPDGWINQEQTEMAGTGQKALPIQRRGIASGLKPVRRDAPFNSDESQEFAPDTPTEVYLIQK